MSGARRPPPPVMVVEGDPAPIAPPLAAAATPLSPRMVVEDAPPGRLDLDWAGSTAPVPDPRRSGARGGLGGIAAGLVVLALGLPALAVGNFITAQFLRGAPLGWLTLLVVAAGYGLVLAGLAREVNGLLALRAVDRARAAFARRDLAAARAEALRWAAGTPAASAILPALREAQDLGTLSALLTAGPLATLDERATALGRQAALGAFAATAISPSPALDALLVVWRGVRLVRQVAATHGLRPGALGTLALLRRTALDAAAIAGTDVAANAVAQAMLSNPLLRNLAGETAGAALAARRMILLGRAAAGACRIVPAMDAT